MLQTSTKKIIDIAVTRGYIKAEQQEEYIYGLGIMIDIIINDITVLAIGFIFNMIWECIIFWVAYKLLRKYCGGFHFSTSIRCYLSSCIMCPVALICIRYIPYNTLLWSIPILLMAILLFIISPVAALTKPLDEKEAIVFGKIARAIVLGLSILYIAMVILNVSVVSKAIALSIVCVTGFAVAGKLETIYLQKNAGSRI